MKKLWIFNQYATDMYIDKGERHYWFSRYLIEKKYDPTIFCANTVHNRDKIIFNDIKNYKIGIVDNIPFVFIKAPRYKNNGLSRVWNMFRFYKNLIKVADKLIREGDKPDIILSSSPQPLVLIAGLKIGKKYNIRVICEVRDLWPESIVAYTRFTKRNPIIKSLYRIEKKAYEKANYLIFTMEGGKDYIIDKKWNIGIRNINLEKVYYINNGVDLSLFNENKIKYNYLDDDFGKFGYKIFYTGSLRSANKSIFLLIKTAELIKKYSNNIGIFIFGGGDKFDFYDNYIKENNLTNTFIKRRVEKKYIPSILNKSNLNILNCFEDEVLYYGGSQNKLFDYLASGKPTISGETNKYSIINKYNCGTSKSIKTEEDLFAIIKKYYEMDSDELDQIKKNCINTAKLFDYKELTKKLIEIIEEKI